jgi:hypothetical protein
MSNENQTKIDSLLGRALRDKEFRQQLIENPAGAAADADLSADELQMIAGGLTLIRNRINPIAFCTEKSCNEGGGAVALRPSLPSLPASLTDRLTRF